jgi:hypothetical protein
MSLRATTPGRPRRRAAWPTERGWAQPAVGDTPLECPVRCQPLGVQRRLGAASHELGAIGAEIGGQCVELFDAIVIELGVIGGVRPTADTHVRGDRVWSVIGVPLSQDLG